METERNVKQEWLFSRWYGWGTPLGLGIFILSLVAALYITAASVNSFVQAGQRGFEIEKQRAHIERTEQLK